MAQSHILYAFFLCIQIEHIRKCRFHLRFTFYSRPFHPVVYVPSYSAERTDKLKLNLQRSAVWPGQLIIVLSKSDDSSINTWLGIEIKMIKSLSHNTLIIIFFGTSVHLKLTMILVVDLYYIQIHHVLSRQIIPIEEYDDDTQDASFFAESLFDSDDESVDQFSSKFNFKKWFIYLFGRGLKTFLFHLLSCLIFS